MQPGWLDTETEDEPLGNVGPVVMTSAEATVRLNCLDA